LLVAVGAELDLVEGDVAADCDEVVDARVGVVPEAADVLVDASATPVTLAPRPAAIRPVIMSRRVRLAAIEPIRLLPS